MFSVLHNDSDVEVSDVSGQWYVSGPLITKYYAAVCYYFGRDIYKKHNGTLPIGLISATWSGTRIEAWESVDSRHVCNDTVVINDPNQASHLWNGMIHPLLWYNIRAVVWYQGESNEKTPIRYQCSFPEMIKDWRSKWGIGDFPFFFVQLAGYAELRGYVELRYAQTFALKLPLVDMATAIDIGDPTNIHPTNKQEVSLRLTLLAGHYLYGSKEAY